MTKHMTKTQLRGMERAHRLITGTFGGAPDTKFPWRITRNEGRMESFAYVLTIEREQGDEGSLLASISREYWLVFIGSRGGITIKMAPKSCQQFNKTRALGVNWDL